MSDIDHLSRRLGQQNVHAYPILSGTPLHRYWTNDDISMIHGLMNQYRLTTLILAQNI